MGQLTGKVAVVTGASTERGIGSAIARRFAQEKPQGQTTFFSFHKPDLVVSAAPGYSASIPAALITLAHLSISALM